jgi:hypothetical protein
VFKLEMREGGNVQLKPEYAQLMNKLTDHSTMIIDAYTCLIFGYAYLGGQEGLRSLFVQSCSSPATQLMPACADAVTQTDTGLLSRGANHAQAEHVQKADC